MMNMQSLTRIGESFAILETKKHT